ncbi:MAG TPA: hypothetical protein VI796_03425 [Candidatus Thermoplasmatota archaeon]|nr:hypothetical protein [Candidatus Thermoplasmatota archaeon]
MTAASQSRGFALSLLAVPLSLLAGCFGFGGPANCGVEIPRVQGGDEFLYDAQGLLRFVDLEPIADWLGDSSDGTNSALNVPPGTTLRVRVSQEPSPRLSSQGFLRYAFQASFSVEVPGREGGIEFADEWIGTDNAQPIQTVLRNVLSEEDQVLHFIRHTRYNRVPLLLGPLFAGQTLEDGMAGEVNIPPERGFPGIGEGVSSVGSIRWDVETSWEKSACEATVKVVYVLEEIKGSALEDHITLRLRNGTPLPVEYSMQDQFRPAKSNLVLSSFIPGNGPALPLFSSVDPAESSMHPVAIFEGCPRGDFTSFPTSCFEARAALGQDAATSLWLEQHPAAEVAKTVHLQGAQDSGVVDRWEFTYADSGGGYMFQVDRKSPLVGIVPVPANEFEVTGMPADSQEKPPAGVASPAGYELETLHRYAYGGTEPEVLDCRWSQGYCGIGTHQGTGMLRAGEPGSAISWVGLMVEIQTGLVLQEAGYDARAIGPPV